MPYALKYKFTTEDECLCTLNTFKFMFMYRNILLENKKGKVGGYTLIQKRKRRKKFVNFIEEIVRLGKDNTSKMSIFEYSRFYLVLIFIQLIDCMVDFDQGIEYIFSSTY